MNKKELKKNIKSLFKKYEKHYGYMPDLYEVMALSSSGSISMEDKYHDALSFISGHYSMSELSEINKASKLDVLKLL